MSKKANYNKNKNVIIIKIKIFIITCNSGDFSRCLYQIARLHVLRCDNVALPLPACYHGDVCGTTRVVTY